MQRMAIAYLEIQVEYKTQIYLQSTIAMSRLSVRHCINKNPLSKHSWQQTKVSAMLPFRLNQWAVFYKPFSENNLRNIVKHGKYCKIILKYVI